MSSNGKQTYDLRFMVENDNFFNGSTIQPYSEVQIHDTFSFQLGFSVTVHKAQGRTIDKVVLDLHYKRNHRKWLGFYGIFVAIQQ